MAIQQPPNWDFDQPQYRAALQSFIGINDPRAQVLLNAAPGNRFKVQISTLGLSDVVGVNANGLRAASPTAWRYLAEANGHAVACEVALDSPRITTLIEGPAVEQAIKALIALQQNKDVSAANYTPVHLRVGGVRLEAHWLRSANGANADLIAPFFTPPNHALQPKPGYPTMAPADFLRAAKPSAQKHLNFYGGDLNSVGAYSQRNASQLSRQTAPLRVRAAKSKQKKMHSPRPGALRKQSPRRGGA